MMSKAKKKRVILDLTPELMENVDALKKRMGAGSRKELILLALGLLNLATEEKNPGEKPLLQIKRGDEVESVVMPLFR